MDVFEAELFCWVSWINNKDYILDLYLAFFHNIFMHIIIIVIIIIIIWKDTLHLHVHYYNK